MARWPLLVALATASFALGFVGFRNYFDGAGIDKSTLDVVYVTLQLYTLESGSVPDFGAPWQLEVARLAAPAFSATALITALAIAFREQIDEWRLRRQRDHVVVCGLGSAGSTLVAALIDSGRRVVAVEADGTAPGVQTSRLKGARIVVGDARHEVTLRQAHVDRASHLVCLAGEDDVNAEIALRAAELVAARPSPSLVCLAHIRDPELCALMRSDELASPDRGGSRLDFFNLDEQGARALVSDPSPLPGTENLEADPPANLVVGLNRLGQSIVVELARRWRSHPAAKGRPCTIAVVDPQAEDVSSRLRSLYTQLDHAARIVPVTTDLDPFDAGAVADVNPVVSYVCIDDGTAALKAGLALRVSGRGGVVVVGLNQPAAMAGLIDRPDRPDPIHAVSIPERTLRADLLLGGTNEVLARAIHGEYLEQQRREGATVAANPALVPWDELPESLRESNRDQAAHIGTKLAAIGRGIAPLADWNAEKITFDDAEVELLAEMEHQRWVDQRIGDGWTEGPKNIEARTTPYLVPWSELTEEVREWDRQAVRGIPTFLVRAGYQVISPAD